MESTAYNSNCESTFAPLNFKPDYSVKFSNKNKMVGALDFNDDVMKFEGEAEESAKLFFDWLSPMFEKLVKDAYQKGYEAAKREII